MNEELIRYLRSVSEFFKPPMCPLERLIYDCGTDFVGKKRPRGIRKLKDKECFANATGLLWGHPELEYVEGFACHASLFLPVQHAWCVNAQGEVVDPTWRWPEKSQYRGIIIPRTRLRKTLLKNRYYGVLCTDFPDLQLIEEIRREHAGQRQCA